MNRRGFLGRVAAAAAAIAGAGAAPKVTEGAQTEHLYTHSEVEQIICREREHAEQTGWVRGFNDAGPMKMSNMADARAEGYDRGVFVATERALSRQALGLPIRRGASEIEREGDR